MGQGQITLPLSGGLPEDGLSHRAVITAPASDEDLAQLFYSQYLQVESGLGLSPGSGPCVVLCQAVSRTRDLTLPPTEAPLQQQPLRRRA